MVRRMKHADGQTQLVHFVPSVNKTAQDHNQQDLLTPVCIYNIYAGDSAHKSQAPSCLGD